MEQHVFQKHIEYNLKKPMSTKNSNKQNLAHFFKPEATILTHSASKLKKLFFTETQNKTVSTEKP